MKKRIILFFVLSLIGIFIGFIFRNSTELGLCLVSEPSCINRYTNIGEMLFYGMSALAIVFLILLFFQNSFPAWKKFAQWFVPLATLLFIFYEGPSSGDYFSPYPEQVFQWVSAIYVLVSVLVILFYSKKMQ